MIYFTNSPYTSETLKGEYRVLCKKLHPDTGGNADAFKEMIREYEVLKSSVGSTHPNSSRSASSSFKQETEQKPKQDEESRYRSLFNLLVNDNGYKNSDILLDVCLQMFRKLAKLPFIDARVRYYSYFSLLKVELEFAEGIEELKVEMFLDYVDELSFTIYSSEGMYMSTDKIDNIIDKVFKKLKD